MPPKKGNKNKKGKSNIEIYNERVNEVTQRQLDIQVSIEEAMAKQLLTGEKLTRAENKRIQDLQMELDVRIQTKNELGRANILSKKQLNIIDDELKTLSKIATAGSSINDLYKDYVKLAQEAAKAKDEDIRKSKEMQMEMIKGEISFRKVQDATKKMKENLADTIPLLGSMYKKMKEISENPMQLFATSFKLGLDTTKDFGMELDNVNQQFGALNKNEMTKMKNTMAVLNNQGAEFDIYWSKIAQNAPKIAESFGRSSFETMTMAFEAAKLSKQFGLGVEEVIDFQNLLVNVVGLSDENAESTMKQMKAWADTEGVVPSAVLRQMATNTEMVAKWTDGTATNLANAAMFATKLGVSMNMIDKAASSVLNFQQSIRDEFEISALLGQRVDLRQARVLAMNKDSLGFARELQNQLGGIDLASLQEPAIRKLAETFNFSFDELSKIVKGTDKITDGLFRTTDELENQNAEYVNLENSVNKVQQGVNLTENMHKVLGQGVAEDWEKITGMAETYNKALRTALGFLNQMGPLLTIGIGLMMGLAGQAWSYANAMMMANSMGGGGGFGMPGKTKFTGRNPKGTSSWNQFRSANKGKGWSRSKMSSQYHKAGGRNWAPTTVPNTTSGGGGRGFWGRAGAGMKGLGKGWGAMSLIGAGMEGIGNVGEYGLGQGLLKTLDSNKLMVLGGMLGMLGGPGGALLGAGIGSIGDMLLSTMLGPEGAMFGSYKPIHAYDNKSIGGKTLISGPAGSVLADARDTIFSVQPNHFSTGNQGGGGSGLSLSPESGRMITDSFISAMKIYGTPNNQSNSTLARMKYNKVVFSQ
tara:strand:+ start:99 stop:2543 length:2445 start_codon:yes stop_codon:yes gene_type:complete